MTSTGQASYTEREDIGQNSVMNMLVIYVLAIQKLMVDRERIWKSGRYLHCREYTTM